MIADRRLPPCVSVPIKTVLLLQDLEFGGTQRYALTLLKSLDREIFSPRLWVLRDGMDMVPIAEEAGIRPVWMSHSSYVGPWALGNLVWRLFTERPHILYTLTVVPNIWGRLFGTLARVPVIISGWRELFPKQYEAWMWKLSKRVICNAHMLRHVISVRSGVDPHRIAVVANGVDHDFFLPDHSHKASCPTVVFVGRLVREKDPLTLLEAFCLLLNRIPEAQLKIVGNGRLRSRIRSFLKKRGMEGSVDLIPGTQDIRGLLSRSWVFAMSSRQDASPNVILEAMSSELPVVATRVGGIPELVLEGQTGLLVEPGNPKAMAEALERLLTDERLRNDLGRNGRKAVIDNHSIEGMARRTEAVLLAAARESEAELAGGCCDSEDAE
jgi:glycosyltransferase involved in cell wall biosynthesis